MVVLNLSGKSAFEEDQQKNPGGRWAAGLTMDRV
jgi:hypothetical protein